LAKQDLSACCEQCDQPAIWYASRPLLIPLRQSLLSGAVVLIGEELEKARQRLDEVKQRQAARLLESNGKGVPVNGRESEPLCSPA
jgi:hypothetical protein